MGGFVHAPGSLEALSCSPVEIPVNVVYGFRIHQTYHGRGVARSQLNC